MKTIILTGRLAKEFGPRFELDVASPAEAVRALCHMVKGFETAMHVGSYRLTKLKNGVPTSIDEDTLGFGMGQADTLRIDPVAKGGKKKGLGKIILGTIIVVGAFMLAPATGGMSLAAMSNVAFGAGTVFATTYATIALQGAMLALYGVSEMISASKQSVGEKNASHLIDATGNLTLQGSAVPIVFGECFVGSVVVSGGTFTNEIEPHKDRGRYDSNMRSGGTARLIDVISEGPIEGLVDGDKSIYLGGTPLQNEDGTYNYKGVSYSYRSGTANQKFVPGFASVEREIGTGNRQVKYSTPYTFTVTDENVDAVRVKIQLPRFGEDDDGFHSITREMKIEVQPDGGAWGNPIPVKFKGKSTGPYERNYRIELPEGGAPWSIRVSRLNTDAVKSKYSDEMFVPSYTEIIDAKLRYPDTALIGLTFDSEEYGNNIQERTYHIRGVKSEVPSNYDPITRKYTGLWDGTFKTAWHNNPAWVMWALQTHTRYGLGDIIEKAAVDKFALYEIGQRCDGLVPNGKGGQEPRYTFNGVIRSREDAYKVLDGIAATFRGMLYWGAGIITTTQDAPEAPSVLVTNANVIDGDFHYAGGALSARHSSVSVQWADPKEQGKITTSVVQRDDLIQKFGDRRTDIALMGCTSESQAHRAAEWLLYTEEHESESISYAASLDHLNVRPGSIISVADQHLAQVRFGGRLRNATATGFDTDAPVDFKPGKEYTVSVVHDDGQVRAYDVANTGPGTTTLTLTKPGAQGWVKPQTDAIWVVTGTDVAPRQYRVLTVSEKEDSIYEVTGLLHYPSKFDHVERDKKLEQPPFTRVPKGAVKPPSGLVVGKFLKNRKGSESRLYVTASWKASPDARVSGYNIYIQEPESPERLVAQTGELSLDILCERKVPGTYTVRVTAVTGLGNESLGIEASTNIGKDDADKPPATPEGWVGTPGFGNISLNGIKHPAPDFRAHVIYGATAESETLTELAEVAGVSYNRTIETGDKITRYKVAARTHGGQESPATAFINVQPIPIPASALDADVNTRIGKAEDALAAHLALVNEYAGVGLDAKFDEIEKDIADTVIEAQAAVDAARLASDEAAKALFETTAIFVSSQQRGVTQAAASRRVCLASGDYDVTVEQDDTEIFVNGTRQTGDTEIGKFSAHRIHKLTLVTGDTVTSTSPLAAIGTTDGAQIQLASLALAGRNFGVKLFRNTPHVFTMVPLTNGQYRVSANTLDNPGRWIPIFADVPVTFTAGDSFNTEAILIESTCDVMLAVKSSTGGDQTLLFPASHEIMVHAANIGPYDVVSFSGSTYTQDESVFRAESRADLLFGNRVDDGFGGDTAGHLSTSAFGDLYMLPQTTLHGLGLAFDKDVTIEVSDKTGAILLTRELVFDSGPDGNRKWNTLNLGSIHGGPTGSLNFSNGPFQISGTARFGISTNDAQGREYLPMGYDRAQFVPMAEAFADAAYYSSQFAASKASEAGAYSASAIESVLTAEAARDASEEARALSEAAATTAVSARDDATGAAANASDSLKLVSTARRDTQDFASRNYWLNGDFTRDGDESLYGWTSSSNITLERHDHTQTQPPADFSLRATRTNTSTGYLYWTPPSAPNTDLMGRKVRVSGWWFIDTVTPPTAVSFGFYRVRLNKSYHSYSTLTPMPLPALGTWAPFEFEIDVPEADAAGAALIERYAFKTEGPSGGKISFTALRMEDVTAEVAAQVAAKAAADAVVTTSANATAAGDAAAAAVDASTLVAEAAQDITNGMVRSVPFLLTVPGAAWTEQSASTHSELPKPGAPKAKFITGDVDFGDCYDFGNKSNNSIGQSYPVEWTPQKMYVVEVGYKVEVDSTGNGGNTACQIGVATFNGFNRTTYVLSQTFTAKKADGPKVHRVLFSEKDLAQINISDVDDKVGKIGAGGKQAFFMFRQNSGASSNGTVRVQYLKLIDFTATVQSLEYATSADAARLTAVEAASAAGDHSAKAFDSLTLASRVVAKGAGVLADQFFMEEGYTVVAYGTAPVKTSNVGNAGALYGNGKTLTFQNTATSTTTGISIRSSTQPEYWRGAQNASGYVVEVEFTLLEGSIDGAGVILDWDTATKEHRQIVSLKDGAQSPVVVGQPNVAIMTFERPEAAANEVFKWHDFYLCGNSPLLPTPALKKIAIHRLNIRVASNEEVGAGIVEAKLKEYAYTKADTMSAIAAKSLQLAAELSGGRMALKGIFDDALAEDRLGQWQGPDLAAVPFNGNPKGRTHVLRSKSRILQYGATQKGNLHGRSYRFTGSYYGYSTAHPIKIGFLIENHGGKPDSFHTVEVGPKGQSQWKFFDVTLKVDAPDCKAYAIILFHDCPEGTTTGMLTYWSELEAYDTTQEQSVRATLTEEYLTHVETNKLQAAAKTELKGEMDALRGDIPGYQIIFESKIGTDGNPIAGSSPEWFTMGHTALTAKVGGVAMGQTDTVILKEASPFTRAVTGKTNGARVKIPAKQALTFSGKPIKISLLARKAPGASGTTAFSLAYATDDVGQMTRTSATPTATWAWHDFYYTVPVANTGGEDWIGIWPDDTQSGKELQVARLVIQLATEVKDLPIIETLGGQVTDIMTLDVDRLSGTAIGKFEQSVSATAFKGDGVLANMYLKGWSSYSSGASKKTLIPPSADLGEVEHTAWEFNTGVNSARGMLINSDHAQWRGVKNADAYTVDVDLEWISGTVNGAGVSFYWTSSVSAYGTHKKLKDVLPKGDIKPGRQKVSFTVERPETFSGTFIRNECQVVANSTSTTYLGSARDAKNFTIHSIQIRPASATEASVTQMGSSIARMDGSASAAYVLRAKAGQQSAGLELVAWQDANGGGASMLRMHADDIVLDGTVTTRKIEVTDFSGNLIVNGEFRHGDLRGWRDATTNTSLIQRGTDAAQPAIVNMPTEWALKMKGTSNEYLYQKDTIPLTEGDEFTLTCKAAKGATGTNPNFQVAFVVKNEKGQSVSGGEYTSWPVTDTAWSQFKKTFTVAKNAVRLEIYIRRISGTSADLYVTDLQLVRKRDGSTIITPNSITTPMLQAGSVTTDKLTVGMSGNMLLNSDFGQGHNDRSGASCYSIFKGGTIGNGMTYNYARLQTGTWSPRTGPSIQMRYTSGATSSGYAYLRCVPEDAAGNLLTGYEVEPNNFYEFHANVSHHGAKSRVAISWYSETGSGISTTWLNETANHGQGRSRAPQSWPRIGGIAQAPSSAYYAVPFIALAETEATTESNLYISRPFLGRTDSLISAWSRYESGPTTVIDGSGIRTKSITAESAVLGDAVVDTLQIAGNAIFVDEQYSFPDTFVPESNNYQNPKTLITKTLTAYGQGGAQVTCTGYIDNTNTVDSFGMMILYINNVEVGRQKFGVRSDGSSDAKFIMPFSLSGVYKANLNAKIELKVYCSSWKNDTDSANSFYVKGGRVSVSASKR